MVLESAISLAPSSDAAEWTVKCLLICYCYYYCLFGAFLRLISDGSWEYFDVTCCQEREEQLPWGCVTGSLRQFGRIRTVKSNQTNARVSINCEGRHLADPTGELRVCSREWQPRGSGRHVLTSLTAMWPGRLGPTRKIPRSAFPTEWHSFTQNPEPRWLNTF